MGNRHGKNAGKEDTKQDGKVIGRSGSKRGSGRKKKDTDKVADSNQNDVIIEGKNPPPGGKNYTQEKPVMRERRAVDDGELGKRPKMGRLSGSFGPPGETQSARRSNVFPDLDASRPDGGNGGMPPKTAELKVYRSFSSLADEQKKFQMYDANPSLANVKVYRKTPETPLNPSQRTMSLPRGFERTGRVPPAAAQGNGKAGERDFVDRGSWGDKRMSAPAMRSTTLPRLHGNAVTSSIASYRVSKDDLPETLAIQRRLKQFENLLVRSILTKFSRLNPESQLSTVPIAIRLGRPNQFVTLRDYVDDPYGLPDDLTSAGSLVLCIAPAMLTGMAHFRRQRSSDRANWPTLARDVVTCVAAEAAAEISRMFEYQIALLTGDSSVALLADHGAERILSFVLYDLQTPRLDRNTIVQGVVRGKRVYNPQGPTTPLNPVYVSVIVGMKELKWNLYEIFDRPGLRKDVMLFHEGVPAPGDDDRCPWKFHTSHAADPMVYGYRGLLIEWDFIQGHFRVNGHDEGSFPEEMSWRFDDFHRLYPPFKRLFGVRAMKRYYSECARGGGGRQPLTLDRFLMQAVHGVTYTRDAIQPVYRPLEPFTLAEIEGVDWSRADVPRVLLPRTGANDVQATLSPSGEFSVFTPALSYGMRPYSQGGATTLNVPQYSSPGYSPGGAAQRHSYSPASRSPVMAQYVEDRSPRTSAYFGEGPSTYQRNTPAQDRSPAVPQSYSPVGTVHQTYSPDGGRPSVSQYYSPGGTLRKIYQSPPETEVKTQFLEVGRTSVPPHYSPGGTLRRNLPANGRLSVQSHSSGYATPTSHSPGVASVPVVQNYSSEVATRNNSVADPRFSGYTLVEEVTTVHSIKASNV